MPLLFRVGTREFGSGTATIAGNTREKRLPQRIQVSGGLTRRSTLRAEWNLKDGQQPIVGGKVAQAGLPVWYGDTSRSTRPIFAGRLDEPTETPYPGSAEVRHWTPTATGIDYVVRRRRIPPDPAALGLSPLFHDGTHAATMESLRTDYMSDVVTSVTGLSTTERITFDGRAGLLRRTLDAFASAIGATYVIRPNGVMHWRYEAATTADITLASSQIQAASVSIDPSLYRNRQYVFLEDDTSIIQVKSEHATEIARVGAVDHTERYQPEPGQAAQTWGTLPADNALRNSRRMAYDRYTGDVWLMEYLRGVRRVNLDTMTVAQTHDIRTLTTFPNQAGSVAVSQNRLYVGRDRQGTIYVLDKADGSRLTDEEPSGIPPNSWVVGLHYEPPSTLWVLYDIVTSGGSRHRFWLYEHTIGTSTFTQRFQIPTSGTENNVGGIAVSTADDAVFTMDLRNQRNTIEEYALSTGTRRRTFTVPGVLDESGIAMDAAGGRLFVRSGNDLVYVRPAGLYAARMQSYADSLISTFARPVRTLTLDLRPQTTMLELPYAQVVRVPAGAWGAAGNWHVESWQIQAGIREGIRHSLNLRSHPTPGQTRIWDTFSR